MKRKQDIIASRPSVRDEIESFSIPEPMSGCFLWLRSVNSRGYAQLGLFNTTVLVSRVLCVLYRGMDLDNPGWVAMHSCDNPICVNWSHIKPGTQKENIDDARAKNRLAKGIKNGAFLHHHHKLSEDDVRQIRKLYANGDISGPELAKRFNVGRSAIYNVLDGVTWRHVK